MRPYYCVHTLYWVSEGTSVWAGVPCHLKASAHTIPGRPCCEHHPDLTDEESAALRGHVTCLDDTVHNWGRGSWNSDSLGPGWVPNHARPCFLLGLALLYASLVGPQLILLLCDPCFLGTVSNGQSQHSCSKAQNPCLGLKNGLDPQGLSPRCLGHGSVFSLSFFF